MLHRWQRSVDLANVAVASGPRPSVASRSTPTGIAGTVGPPTTAIAWRTQRSGPRSRHGTALDTLRTRRRSERRRGAAVKPSDWPRSTPTATRVRAAGRPPTSSWPSITRTRSAVNICCPWGSAVAFGSTGGCVTRDTRERNSSACAITAIRPSVITVTALIGQRSPGPSSAGRSGQLRQGERNGQLPGSGRFGPESLYLTV